ncbi:MAG: apolipoprotein N-acyltransferase [Luteitalea sp.]|nr:apolipoprotein N-acyltransferase [Luteitalea sp.]
MAAYGGLHIVVAVLVNGLLIAYLSLFPALFAVITARLTAAGGAPALLLAPCVWVATELGRTHLFTGFPWVLLGYSQANVLPVAQVASLSGVYGLSALVAAVSAAMAYAAVTVRRRYLPLAAVLALIGGLSVWGSLRIARATLTDEGQALRVGLIQGNVAQQDKWDESKAGAIFAEYLRMTRQAIGRGAEIVLWPESATPFYFEEDRAGADQVRRLAREARVPILLGSDQIERGAAPKYYNAAFLVRADGSSGGVYRKMHLVPFGEYVPLKRVLFFAGPLVEAVSDFSAGQAAVLLPVNGHLLSTSICYEVVYPDLVRQSVKAGSELLTTITNDAWFGRTSAPYQHFSQAAMRAIENGRYLVRSANTGISGIVDPYGRVLENTGIFAPAIVVGEARFLQGSTLYSRFGDVIAYASTLVAAVALLLVRRSAPGGRTLPASPNGRAIRHVK